MGLKLQGLAHAMRTLDHEVEVEAEKLHAEIMEVRQGLPTVFSEARSYIGNVRAQVGDVKGHLSEVQAVANGAPPIDGETPAAAPALSVTTRPRDLYQGNVKEPDLP